jgi:hypothetical protein
LEARLIFLAKERNRCILDNGNIPTLPSLSDMDKDDVENFLQEILLCLPILGINIFEEPVSSSNRQNHKLLLYAKGPDADGTGFESDEGFVVLKGSKARIQETPSIKGSTLELRSSLIDRGILSPGGKYFIFSQDYVFDSPSMAAAIILARSASGPKEWKDKDGSSLEDLRNRP